MRRQRFVIWTLAVALAVMSVVFLVARYHVAPGMLYPPVPSHSADAWKDHEVTFERDGATLKGWHIRKPGGKLLVFYGGNGQDSARLLGMLSRNIPYSLLVVNYRGYGGSSGTPSEKRLVEDSASILDEIVSREGLSYDDVVLFGQSLGSGVAVQVAARRPVGKLVLLVPFDSVSSVADGIAPPLRLSWLVPDSYRSDLFAPHVAAPVTILAAGNDEIVPVEHARRLRDVFRSNRGGREDSVHYREYPQAGHKNMWSQPGLWEYLRKEIKPD